MPRHRGSREHVDREELGARYDSIPLVSERRTPRVQDIGVECPLRGELEYLHLAGIRVVRGAADALHKSSAMFGNDGEDAILIALKTFFLPRPRPQKAADPNYGFITHEDNIALRSHVDANTSLRPGAASEVGDVGRAPTLLPVFRLRVENFTTSSIDQAVSEGDDRGLHAIVDAELVEEL